MPNPFGDEEVKQQANPFGDVAERPAEQTDQSATEHFANISGERGNFATQAIGSIPLMGRAATRLLANKGPRADKARQVLDILESGEGSDKQKIKQIKQILPAAKFGKDPSGRFMIVGGKRLRLFTQGTENFPAVPVPIHNAETPQQRWEAFKKKLITGIDNPGRDLTGPIPHPVDTQIKKNPELAKSYKTAEKAFNRVVKQGKDIYGNQVVNVKIDYRLPDGTEIKAGTYYLDSPLQVTGQDVREIPNKLLQMSQKPSVVASTALAGPGGGFFGVLGRSMLGAGLGQTAEETANVMKGKEFDAGNIASETLTTGVGVGIAGIIGKAAGVITRLLPKSAPKVTDKNVVQVLRAMGKTDDQITDDIIKHSGQSVSPATRQRIKDYVSVNRVPTKGQATPGSPQAAREREIFNDPRQTLLPSRDVKAKVAEDTESIQRNLLALSRGDKGPVVTGRAARTGAKESKSIVKGNVDTAYKNFEASIGGGKQRLVLPKDVAETITRHKTKFTDEVKKAIDDLELTKGAISVENYRKAISAIGKAASKQTDEVAKSELFAIQSKLKSTLEKFARSKNPKSMELLRIANKKFKNELREFHPNRIKIEGERQPKSLVQKILGKGKAAENFGDDFFKLDIEAMSRTLNTLKRSPKGQQAKSALQRRFFARLAQETESMAKSGKWTNNQFDAKLKLIMGKEGFEKKAKIFLTKEQRKAVETLRRLDPSFFGNARTPQDLRRLVDGFIRNFIRTGVGLPKGKINVFLKGAKKAAQPNKGKPTAIGGIIAGQEIQKQGEK